MCNTKSFPLHRPLLVDHCISHQQSFIVETSVSNGHIFAETQVSKDIKKMHRIHHVSTIIILVQAVGTSHGFTSQFPHYQQSHLPPKTISLEDLRRFSSPSARSRDARVNANPNFHKHIGLTTTIDDNEENEVSGHCKTSLLTNCFDLRQN